MSSSSNGLSSRRVCLLYQGDNPHPSHAIFGKAVDADFIHFETGDKLEESQESTDSELDRLKTGLTLSRSYDVVIAEGSAPLQTLLVHGVVNPSATLVFLAADETFYEIRDKPTRFLWYSLSPLTRQLDLCISISNLVTDWVSPFLSGVPYRIVHPTTTSAKFDKLLELDAHYPETPFSILSVGDDREMKNYSVLVDAVEAANANRQKDISLTIIGDGHPEKPYASKQFVSTPGRVSEGEFVSYFDDATAYIQPSLGDGFGVAALEGMLAGLPTIVTEKVGAKQLISDEWVAKPTRDGLINKIKNLSQLSSRECKRIGERNRRTARSISPSSQKEAFRNVIESLD